MGAFVGAVISVGLVCGSLIICARRDIGTNPQADGSMFGVAVLAIIVLYGTPAALIGAFVGALIAAPSNTRAPNGEDVSTAQPSSEQPRLPAKSAQDRRHSHGLSATDVDCHFGEKEQRGSDDSSLR